MAQVFKPVHAQCVVSQDAPVVRIEFLNRNEMSYRCGDRSALVPREIEYSDTGIPTGVAVYLDGLQWNDGSLLTEAELTQLMADLYQAANLLRVKNFVRAD